MKDHIRTLIATTILLGCAMTAGPITSAVAGDSTCTYDSSTRRVTVGVNPANSEIFIFRDGDEIKVFPTTDCGDATRFNTNRVVVNDPASHDVSAVLDLSIGGLKPGFRNEPGGSDEIEVEFNLGDGTNSFQLQGGPTANYFTAGAPPTTLEPAPTKVNVNANEHAGIDADVFLNGAFNSVQMLGYDGDDRLSAQGGVGTGEALLGDVRLDGLLDSDTLIGGDGPDIIYAGNGPDTVRGMRGADDLKGGWGGDSLDGGPGFDSCDGGPGTNTLERCEA